MDPCLEHTPSPSLTPSPSKLPAAKPGAKPTPKSTSATLPVDKASRSLLQAFQQDLLPAFGKEWVGITGNASFVPTETQYAQLLRQAPGVVYCGMGCFLHYVPPALVAQADMRGCELALVLDRAQNVKSAKRQMLHRG